MDTTIQIRNYYNKIANSYDNLYVDDLSIAENKIVKELLLDKIKSLNKVRIKILDLGCGTGLAYQMIHEACCNMGILIDYVGIDISDKMIHIANEKHRDISNCQFKVGNMSDLNNIETNSFDLVTSVFGSFSHSSEYEKTLEEINRVLKLEGAYFLMVYSRFSFRNIYSAIFGFKWQKLFFKQKYDVRNNNSKISCEAFFFWKKKITHLLEKKNLKVNKVLGLNIFFETSIFKPLLKTNKNALKVLKFELKLGRVFPNLGHSLIIEGTSNKKYYE